MVQQGWGIEAPVGSAEGGGGGLWCTPLTRPVSSPCRPTHPLHTMQADVLNRGFAGYHNEWLEYLLPGLFG